MPDTPATHEPIPMPEPETPEWANLTHTGRAPAPEVDSEPLPPFDPTQDEEDEHGEGGPRAEEAPGEGGPGPHDHPDPHEHPGPGGPPGPDRWWPRPRPPRPAPYPGSPSDLGLRKFRDRLTLPPVIRAWRRPDGAAIRIRAELAQVRLHADLPPTTAWTYEGSLPGPTIEVRRGEEVRIDWENALTGHDGHAAHLPYDVVRVPERTTPGLPFNGDTVAAMTPGGRSTSRGAGADSFPPLPHTEGLTAATVVHLHGSLTHGHDDGWAHNVTTPGYRTRCTYPNDQQAATLWYHDHAMAVTRFTVHAGLAGLYLVRDQQEQSLRLPSGDEELSLVLADRNLESAPPQPGDGPGMRFTGRPLYKQAGFTTGPRATPGEVPQTGPFNTVNGTIWPRLDTEPRWLRLRVVNGANGRIYRLAVHDTTDEVLVPGTPVPAGTPAFTAHRVDDALVVIGTDGGLLPAPVRPATGTIDLGPGERLDLLLDLTAYRGRTLELRNELGGALNAQPGVADASIMQIVVADRPVRDRFRLPSVLNRDYDRYEHTADGKLVIGDEVVEQHGHTWIAVLPPGVRGSVHPEVWELAQLPPGAQTPDTDCIQVTRGEKVLSFHPVAKLFDDPTTIFVSEGEWVVWNILHLGGPDHPMHIHMTEFQMLTRRQWPLATQGGRVPELDLATGCTTTPLPEPLPGRPIDEVTAGMKDTWVVRAGEWVQVLGHFAGAAGSFMYHCHILDHEDHTMMRPFVVLPPGLMAFHRGHGGGHH